MLQKPPQYKKAQKNLQKLMADNKTLFKVLTPRLQVMVIYFSKQAQLLEISEKAKINLLQRLMDNDVALQQFQIQ